MTKHGDLKNKILWGRYPSHLLCFYAQIISCLAASGGGAAGAQGAAEGHAAPAGGETAVAGRAETTRQREGAGEGDVLPAEDT